MKDAMQLRLGRYQIPLPRGVWHRLITRKARGFAKVCESLSQEDQRVRNLVVEALPAAGGPLPPEAIAVRLKLPVDGVISILDGLERKLAFLARNRCGAVEWAYPVTVAATPHHLVFESGERMTAA